MLRLLLLALLGASLLVVGCDLQRDHSFRVLKGRLLISNLLRSHGREALWSMRPETRMARHTDTPTTTHAQTRGHMCLCQHNYATRARARNDTGKELRHGTRPFLIHTMTLFIHQLAERRR